MKGFGRYELVTRLASGGMAEVHLARMAEGAGAGRLVVIKRIHSHLAGNTRFVRMFLDEARIAARLSHPQVVQVVDLGRVGEHLFLAMEYVHGEDLRRVVRRALETGRPLPPALGTWIVSEAAAGLHYAHERRDTKGLPLGIVHRDVSPQNLIVTFDGNVKVIDFGIARAADSAHLTRAGELKGKYAYMSPEQARGAPVDRRTDVFALGVLLWELLTGRRLFKRSTDMQTVSAVTACEVPAPSSVRPQLPADFDPILLAALAPHPADRLQTADDLRNALLGVLHRWQVPVSRLELRAFMQGLYAERLAAEARAGRPIPSVASRRRSSSPSGDVSNSSKSSFPASSVPPPSRSSRPPPARLSDPPPPNTVPLRKAPVLPPAPEPAPARERTPRPVASALDSPAVLALNGPGLPPAAVRRRRPVVLLAILATVIAAALLLSVRLVGA